MVENFVRHLTTRDRAGFAELRRSLAFEPGTHAPAFRHVEPFAANLRYDWDRTAYYLVAGLFALVERPLEPGENPPPASPSDRTLGHAIWELYLRRDMPPSIEARFIALLDADDEQLPDRLRQTLSLLRAEGVSVPWAQLLGDLLAWNHPDRYVQRRWARAFYQRTAPQPDPSAADAAE